MSNVTAHSAIPLRAYCFVFTDFTMMSMLQIAREAGPCEKLLGSVPMHPSPRYQCCGPAQQLSCMQRQAWNLPKVSKIAETTGHFIWVWTTFVGMWVSTEGRKERWGEGKRVRGWRVELSLLSHPCPEGMLHSEKMSKNIYMHRSSPQCGLWEQLHPGGE